MLTSGDPKQDNNERAQFARLARGKHQLEPDPLNGDKMILSIGSQDWPFPVPLVRSGGKWSFDASEGALEMRARRIGANELDAIEILAGAVAAQEEYAAQDRDNDGLLEYARRIMSSPGRHDGLYWEGSAQSLVPREFAGAAADRPPATHSSAKPAPYHGYYFRVLTGQGPDARGGRHNYLVKDSMIGGFAFVAWPAEYGVTGIHAFIVNHNGLIFEKDMGRPAAGMAAPVTTYNPDKTWTRVD
ncbi:MAG: DUF2950 family protein [Bryobacteraceae bacterium]